MIDTHNTNNHDYDIHVSLHIDDADMNPPKAFNQGLLDDISSSVLRHATVPKTLPPSQNIQLSLAITTDDNIQKLNKQYRDKDKPTNVLSFSFLDENGLDLPPDMPFFLGDIIISHETIMREAAEQEKTPLNHYIHMFVHGCLHVLGYDHENDAEAEEMEALEIQILSEIDIPNPYIDTNT